MALPCHARRGRVASMANLALVEDHHRRRRRAPTHVAVRVASAAVALTDWRCWTRRRANRLVVVDAVLHRLRRLESIHLVAPRAPRAIVRFQLQSRQVASLSLAVDAVHLQPLLLGATEGRKRKISALLLR